MGGRKYNLNAFFCGREAGPDPALYGFAEKTVKGPAQRDCEQRSREHEGDRVFLESNGLEESNNQLMG